VKDGHVLIVDDDMDLLEVTELLLRDAGYETATALNGKQALDAVGSSMPGLIVLDMLMPVMDGWQFAREFRARHGRDVPIVVVTAAEHARARCQGIDAAEVLTKPFNASELLRAVGRHLPHLATG
jgi:CheY-like chemotaxis protein